MPKLMLIDGNSLVNRAYYGVRPLSAPDGTPTNAVFGFLNILQRLLDDEKPDALCVMFDRREPTFRHKHSEAYKATRKPMPDDLAAQMPVLKDVLDALGIERRELSGWEADDLLGTVSRIGAERGWECVVVTGDKDALQLVGDHVRVLNVKTRMGQTETVNYTPERFREEYGFDAPHMVDLKALMGDTSDNIPGVPGVGEKTALELVRKYGSLAGVYEHISDPDIRASLRTKLENGKESAEDSYYLATIDRKAPIDISPDELRRPADYGGAAYAIFQRLGFQKFIEKWSLKPAAEEKKEETVFEGTCESVTPQTEKDLRAALERAGDAVAYYWFDAESGETLAHFSVSENDALAVFLTPEAYRDGYTAALALLFAPERRKAGHDVKNLQRALLARGVDALENWVFDSALAGYLLDATAAGYEIEKLTLAYCGFTPHTSSGAADSGDQLMLDLSGGEGKRSPTGSARWPRARRASRRSRKLCSRSCARRRWRSFLQRSSCRSARCLPKWKTRASLPTRRRCAPSARVLRAASTRCAKRFGRRQGRNSTSSPRSSSAPCFLKSSVSPAGKRPRPAGAPMPMCSISSAMSPLCATCSNTASSPSSNPPTRTAF